MPVSKTGPAFRSGGQVRHTKPRSARYQISELEQEISWRTWFPKVEVDWTAELSDEEVAVFHAAFLSFCESNLSIKFPGKGRQPFVLRPAQSQVVWDWLKYRKNICLKARQIGFSTLCAAYTLWSGFGWGDRHIVMLSRTERESVALLSKARYAFRAMPEWVRNRGPKLLDRTRQVMTFDNDSLIQSLPSANDPARGESLFLVILDEWAFLTNPEEAWSSVEPTVDLGGRVIGLSTANGEGTFFHQMWLGSQMGTNGFNGIFFPWSAVTERTQEWYDRKREELADRLWLLHQEYPSNAEEAFIGSGNPVFDLELIRKFKAQEPSEWTISGSSSKDVSLFEGGPFLIWDAPNHEDRWTYTVGADPAFGLDHGDATVAWVLCVNTGLPVAVWYGKVDADVFGEAILPAIGWFYRNALVVPEVNNHGLTVLRALQRVKYKWIYKRRSFTKRNDRPLESMGWFTTHTSKPLMIDELGKWLRDVDNVPHKVTLHELKTFTRDHGGKMSGSPHDDCVMALALAVQGLTYARTEHSVSDVSPDKVKGSFAWYERILDKKNTGKRSGLSPIG
jgi:hypothetical protein